MLALALTRNLEREASYHNLLLQGCFTLVLDNLPVWPGAEDAASASAWLAWSWSHHALHGGVGTRAVTKCKGWGRADSWDSQVGLWESKQAEMAGIRGCMQHGKLYWGAQGQRSRFHGAGGGGKWWRGSKQGKAKAQGSVCMAPPLPALSLPTPLLLASLPKLSLLLR